MFPFSGTAPCSWFSCWIFPKSNLEIGPPDLRRKFYHGFHVHGAFVTEKFCSLLSFGILVTYNCVSDLSICSAIYMTPGVHLRMIVYHLRKWLSIGKEKGKLTMKGKYTRSNKSQNALSDEFYNCGWSFKTHKSGVMTYITQVEILFTKLLTHCPMILSYCVPFISHSI